MCAFARKAFDVGDEILREEALIVLDAVNVRRVSDREPPQSDEQRVEKLPAAKRNTLWRLSDCEELEGAPRSLPGIFRTNCIPLTLANESKDHSPRYVSVCVHASMLLWCVCACACVRV